MIKRKKKRIQRKNRKRERRENRKGWFVERQFRSVSPAL